MHGHLRLALCTRGLGHRGGEENQAKVFMPERDHGVSKKREPCLVVKRQHVRKEEIRGGAGLTRFTRQQGWTLQQ